MLTGCNYRWRFAMGRQERNLLEIIRLQGGEARPYGRALADLRVRVFRDYPYIYEGTAEYEEHYLERYFAAEHSLIVLLRDGDRFVGATTGMHAAEEEGAFRLAFTRKGFDPQRIFYCGESVLLSEYRGQGWGKAFFQEREAYARGLGGIEALSFCAVVRPEQHPRRPKDYEPLDGFWQKIGFHKVPGLTTIYEWLDLGETQPTEKLMQFWMKDIRSHG